MNVPFAADSLLLDPDWWLISANNTVTKVAVGTDEPDVIAAQIFPNPASESFTVSIGNGVLFDRVQVFDISGKLVKNIENQRVSSCNLNLSGFPDGIYEIKLPGGKTLASGKVVKQ